jgi:hypothetical protein
MSEARVNRKGRFDRLEERLGRIEETIIRMDATLTATLPHLATKAELADLRTDVLTQLGQKPSHAYLWRFRPSTTWSIQIWAIRFQVLSLFPRWRRRPH